VTSIETLHGWFDNPQGYAIHKLKDQPYLGVLSKAVYQCVINFAHPLTYHDAKGRRYKTQPVFKTDMGSTPIITRHFFPKDRYLVSYLFHDDAWRSGGLFVAQPGEDDYTFERITRTQANKLLGTMIMAEGGSQYAAQLVKAAVDMAALWLWMRGENN